jgi:plasmid maintenance system killer protein
MIKNFLHKGLAEFFYEGTKKGISPKHAPKIADLLDRLDVATSVQDMNYPGVIYTPYQENGRAFGQLRSLPIGESFFVWWAIMPLRLII